MMGRAAPMTRLDGVLQSLDRMRLDNLARRLGLKDHRLLGEGVDALALLRSGLLSYIELHQARDHDLARFMELLHGHLAERVQRGDGLLLVHAGLLCKSIDELGLAHSSGHGLSPSSFMVAPARMPGGKVVNCVVVLVACGEP